MQFRMQIGGAYIYSLGTSSRQSDSHQIAQIATSEQQSYKLVHMYTLASWGGEKSC